ncbi:MULTISPECIES: SMI1/KNR4 family protein [unclassified Streptomyces]|uniref:SMI1/KNR4 family protein n=1 Tax=unclassified Streptomyces TaxID=2593676 RepID=UPI0036F86732
MSGESFNWRDFLERWQREWVPRAGEDAEGEGGGTPVAPLGRPGASEAEIAAAEERLGCRLPPSYRQFLAVSDGWHVQQSAGIYHLGGAADIDWFQDPYDLTPLYEENLGDHPREEDVLLAGMWRRALRLETDSDMSHALLDPGDRDEDGEWALYVHKGWSGELPDRYPSFRAYMEAMYRGFHADRASRPDFVNATTRTQDAKVTEGRRLALCGRYEEALPLLEEALSFGRPGSAVLVHQLRHLSAPYSSQGYGDLVADPRYLPEILPVEAMAPAQGTWRLDGDDHWLRMMAARGAARESAEAVLNAMRAGTYRYAPSGLWGRAVAEAHDAALQGLTDDAWRILREALPRWEAPGPALIAPIGLLADPVLGPLVTPERGRELLATPRSGHSGISPEPVPDLDPPGLTWLAHPTADGQSRDGYRGVWVEGTDPARLPALIGEEGAELSAPLDPYTALRRTPPSRDGGNAEPWEDRAVVAVGRTREGWAFAFDGHSFHRLGKLFQSPAAAASASGRAVVVWRDPASSFPRHPAAFHLSVAEEGEERYAFTVRGSDIERSGAIPPALDPAAHFRPGETELDGEDSMLEALHTELGLSLPRFALTRGRLRTFTTRSWTRAPREGEGYATLGFIRHRP